MRARVLMEHHHSRGGEAQVVFFPSEVVDNLYEMYNDNIEQLLLILSLSLFIRLICVCKKSWFCIGCTLIPIPAIISNLNLLLYWLKVYLSLLSTGHEGLNLSKTTGRRFVYVNHYLPNYLSINSCIWKRHLDLSKTAREKEGNEIITERLNKAAMMIKWNESKFPLWNVWEKFRKKIRSKSIL